MKQTIQVSRGLAQPCMDVMNFLNEAAARYPRAISFAAGRPPDCFASAERAGQWMAAFVASRCRSTRLTEESIWRSLGQYGAAAGMISDAVAKWLANDEGLTADPRDLVITNGMQEAVLLLLLCLCQEPADAILSDDPTYVGLAGAAVLGRVPLFGLEGPGSVVERTARALARAAQSERRARALYVIPDFSNPSGQTLTLEDRRALLDMAVRERFLLIEDTAYRAFRYEGEQLPSLKALDSQGVVIQVGSFSKLFMPGPRVAYVYADQMASITGGPNARLTEQLAKAKSFVSVLTSPVAQAMVGGFLGEHDFSLAAWNRPRIERCRANRDAMLQALADLGSDELRGRVRWTRPEGGFFLTVSLPFRFGHEDMLVCARDYGLIVCPLSYFSTAEENANGIRLSFSNLNAQDAREGVSRLYRFIRDGLSQHGPRASSLPQAPPAPREMEQEQ